MFQNSLTELKTRTKKDNDGISYELYFYINLNSDELSKLKEFREQFAKTSPLHFNFEEDNFLFSQKKYYKKSQFINNPPILEDIKSNFLSEVKNTLDQYNNLIQFDQLENQELSEKMDITEVLK